MLCWCPPPKLPVSSARPKRKARPVIYKLSKMRRKVNEKWGFGLAPPKAETQAARTLAARTVLAWLESQGTDAAVPSADLSEVKGLFNRVVRQDQWDWFTVAGQLGYPSWRTSSVIANALYDAGRRLRTGTTGGHSEREHLRRLPTRRCLRVFLGDLKLADEPGSGWVYVLSTREMPDLLKIGMTTRTVETRAWEINSATGVSIPFGVRHCWRVADPVAAERLVHARLGQFRLRNDREFFRIDYFEARKWIQATLDDHDLELRTLDRLSALGDD